MRNETYPFNSMSTLDTYLVNSQEIVNHLHLANSQEIVNHLIMRLSGDNHHESNIIPDLNIYDFDPWNLPQLPWINSNERERYYFSPLLAKSPGSNSGRYNRSTKTGSWQAKGAEKPIEDELNGQKIGEMRIYVHSHKENGVKWVMHEYKATLNLPNQETLALCKIMKKQDKMSKRTDKKAKRKIASCNEGEPSFNVDSVEEQNAYEKTGLSTNNKDQMTDNNSTYNEGETGCLTTTAAENYLAAVTIQDEHQEYFPYYNQQDYSYYALGSPMLTEQGFPYNDFNTSGPIIEYFPYYNQQDYSYYALGSPMLTEQGFPYNDFNTSGPIIDDPFYVQQPWA